MTLDTRAVSDTMVASAAALGPVGRGRTGPGDPHEIAKLGADTYRFWSSLIGWKLSVRLLAGAWGGSDILETYPAAF
jgi:hypothetical protein